ncbi:hypothetical protein FRC10_004435 [Ceratobasidium sp. 414]|nr:hypothetical protein FRC10_004435 [Ceratobasidium sp. 414]
MQFQSRLARLLAVVLVLLQFSMFVCAAPAPAVAPAGNDLAARCTGGCGSMTDILVKLKADLDVKLVLLDGCYNTGANPAGIITDIVVIINVAVAAIAGLNTGLLGLLSGNILVIAKLCLTILVTVGTHCAKWGDKAGYDAFLSLCAAIDIALVALLSACGGLLGGVLVLVASLSTSANLAILIKVKFTGCLGLLGLL